MQTLRFAIEGIHCPGCVGGIENRLTLLGIDHFEFDYNKRVADITFDDNRLSVDDLVITMAHMGYRATLRDHVSEDDLT